MRCANHDKKVNILLVDDQPRNLLALEAILDVLGQNLVKAHSGQEALKCLLHDDFGLILMDALMPGMDGFETAALIRQRERSSHTPIIFLTAIGKSEMQMFKGYSVGAVDYLFKPIVPEVLRSKVAVFVDLFKKTAEIRRQADQLREMERLEHERQLADVQARWEAERLRLSVRVAQHIQERLFPAAPPVQPGFDICGATYPAEAMGGDYYDFVPMLDQDLGIVIGDVSGHGFGPALLMAATRAYLRALALEHRDAGRILELANKALAADVADEHFITLLLARLDPRTPALVYSGAGHVPGYVLAASGEVRAELTSDGLPLGVVRETSYPTAERILLEAGDVVLLMTDGVTETHAGGDEQFGIARALGVVQAERHRPAREIVGALYQAVRSFALQQPQDDDISAIVVKVDGIP